jgi:hypothetical protein
MTHAALVAGFTTFTSMQGHDGVQLGPAYSRDEPRAGRQVAGQTME